MHACEILYSSTTIEKTKNLQQERSGWLPIFQSSIHIVRTLRGWGVQDHCSVEFLRPLLLQQAYKMQPLEPHQGPSSELQLALGFVVR